MYNFTENCRMSRIIYNSFVSFKKKMIVWYLNV